MILVIAAMNQERDAFLSLCSHISHEVVRGIDVAHAKLDDKEVMVALSGIALVNATFTTSILCEVFSPTAIINIGSAGGLLDTQSVGDLCMATTLRQHDLNIGDTTHIDPRFVYTSDPTLLNFANEAADALGLTAYSGIIVSGDQFVVHDSYELQRIHTLYQNAICVEMEGYAIGMVASKYNIPFLILRSLSDVPLKHGNEVAFETYLPLAAKQSSLICKAVISKL
jgi:adenosylhomocysteine nucleosidase